MRRYTLTLAVALASLAIGAAPAHASMVLTAAGTNAGLTLSTFADSFAAVGPIGITFPVSGGVLVSEYSGAVLLFPTDTDGQHANSITPAQNYGGGNGDGLTTLSGSVYMVEQSAGAVVQLNNTGTLNHLLATGIPGATAIAGNPANGLLYVSGPFGGGIVAVNATNGTKTTFAPGSPDGLTLDPVNQILYAEDGGQIVGYQISNGALVFQSGAIAGGPDGAALGEGVLSGNLFVNTNAGTIVEVNLGSKAQTLVASGGSRGDLIAADPNGSLLLTQSDTVLRLSPPQGGTFGSTTPEPGTIGLMLSGCLAALWVARRRRCNR